MKTHCLRLIEGEDIKESISNYCKKNNILAAVVISSAGCVKKAVIRDAGGKESHSIDEGMEVISVNGTVSKYRIHLHISFSKKDLSVIGGHMQEGCIVNTTCELVILELDNTVFNSEFDPSTGYDEIDISFSNTHQQ
ncbi:MAG: PPC domain-containing DNA-binding protein [Clostridia bacterium]